MRHSSVHGFTLVETVIIVGISAAVMVAIGLLVFMFNKIAAYERAASLSSGSATVTLHELDLLVSASDAVLASHSFTGGTRTSSSTALILEIPSINSSGNIIASTYDYALFYLGTTTTSSTTLYRLLEPNGASVRQSGTRILSSTVSTLSFTYDDSDYTEVTSVTVDLATRVQVRQDVATDHRRQLMVLKNH